MESGRVQEVPYDEYEDPWAGMTIEEMKAADTFADEEIKVVTPSFDEGGRLDGYTFTTAKGTGFGIYRSRAGDALDEIKPNPGSTVRVYPGTLGNVHGVDIDGVEAFWKTPMERDLERLEWLADHDRSQREEFAERKPKLDADFAALPDPLKARIQRFRDEDPGFRVTSESYELFCCVEAAKFAKAANKAANDNADALDVARFWGDENLRLAALSVSGIEESVWGVDPGPDKYAERWLLWAWALNTEAYDYDHARQFEALDAEAGHSGNTFGGAMMCALRLLRGDEV